MFSSHMIYAVVEWERRLELENEKRKDRRAEPHDDAPADPCPCQKEPASFLARIFRSHRKRQSVYPCN